MNDLSLVTGEADAGLRDRLDEELNAFNAAVTGHHDDRTLSIAVRGDRGDLRAGLYGWTWGGCGYSECGRTPGYPHAMGAPSRPSASLWRVLDPHPDGERTKSLHSSSESPAAASSSNAGSSSASARIAPTDAGR